MYMTADFIAIVQWTVNVFHQLYADQGQSYILQLQRLIIWTALESVLNSYLFGGSSSCRVLNLWA